MTFFVSDFVLGSHRLCKTSTLQQAISEKCPHSPASVAMSVPATLLLPGGGCLPFSKRIKMKETKNSWEAFKQTMCKALSSL